MKVIDREKKMYKTIREVFSQSFLEINPVQNEVLPPHKL